MKNINLQDKIIFNLLWTSKHFFGVKNTKKIFREFELNFYQKIENKLKKNGLGKKIEIPTIDNDWEEFGKKAIRKNEPLILKKGAIKWTAINKWSPQFFKDNYGHVKQLKIKKTGQGIYQDKLEQKYTWTTLADIIGSFGPDSNEYASFNPIVHDHKELMNDFDYKKLFNLRHKISSGTQYQLFIGQDKTYTDLHSTIVNNFFIQISGKKRWRLYDPKWAPLIDIAITREPCFHSRIDIATNINDSLLKYADYYEFELEPGDVFYNPPFQWHRVENIGDSIGLAFKWTSPHSFLRKNMTQALLTTCSTRPFVWKVLGNNGNYMNTFID